MSWVIVPATGRAAGFNKMANKPYRLRFPFTALIPLSLAVMLALIAFLFRVSYSDTQLTHSDGTVESISLPLSRSSVGGPTVYVLEGQIFVGLLAPKSFRVIPDDRVMEIRINDQDVPLDAYTYEELGNWSTGFVIDLSPFLRVGKNTFLVRYSDVGAPGLTGMKLQNPADFWYWLLIISFFVLLTPLCVKLSCQRGVNPAHLFIYALIFVGSVIRAVCIFVYNPVNHIGSDAQRHWESGVDVLRADLMAMTDPIMYQLYISWLAKLSLKIPELVAFYTSALSIITPWIWYRYFRELQNSKTVALAGWAILALLPSWISIYSYFMQETLLLPLLGAALWATWRARRKATVGAFCLMVVLWTIAGLTRGITIPLAAVCCTWLWLSQYGKLPKAIYSSLILLLIMGPLTYRSYQIVHHFAPHGMGHLAAIYGMSGKREILLHTRRDGYQWTHIFGSPSTGAEPFAPFSDWRTKRTGRVVVSVDLNKGREDWDKAYESVALNFERFRWITKENLIFLFFASSWPDNNPSRVIDQINIVMRWIWAPATFAVLVGVVVFRRKLRSEWMLPTLLLVWFVVQGLLPISVNEGRYRKPFEGLLVAQCALLLGLRRKQDALKNEIGNSMPPTKQPQEFDATSVQVENAAT